MLFPSTGNACLQWFHAPIHSFADYKTSKSVSAVLVPQQAGHSQCHASPCSSVLTSLALWHSIEEGSLQGDQQARLGQLEDKTKAPKGYPVKLCGASQTCSVQQEVSISQCFISKMSLPEPVPAQTGLYSQLLHQVSSANWAAEEGEPAPGWVSWGAAAAWHWISCLYRFSPSPPAQPEPL